MCVFVALAIQGMFSSRQELDAEIEKLQQDVLFAQEENWDISALEKGIEAERRLPELKLLRSDPKFRTMQDMIEEIKFLSMDLEEMSSLEDRLSIVKKIKALLEQLGPDKVCAIDESNLRGRLRDVLTNDKKRPSTNLENEGTDSKVSKENHVSVVQAHDDKKPSITMRLQRLEGIVGRAFVQRLDLLEECWCIVNDTTVEMKLEHRIAQLEQRLEYSNKEEYLST